MIIYIEYKSVSTFLNRIEGKISTENQLAFRYPLFQPVFLLFFMSDDLKISDN